MKPVVESFCETAQPAVYIVDQTHETFVEPSLRTWGYPTIDAKRASHQASLCRLPKVGDIPVPDLMNLSNFSTNLGISRKS